MPSNWFNAQLIWRELIAKDTIGIWLERPAGYMFQAGQYTILGLPELEGDEAERYLSFAGGEDEPDLFFAVRNGSSVFKHELMNLKIGDPVRIQTAGGTLQLGLSDRPTVMLAGGMGITPFISLLRSRGSRHTMKQPIALLYSNRLQGETAFTEELAEMDSDPTLKHAITYTRERLNQQVNHGRITRTMIDSISHALVHEQNYLIAGSHQFLSGMRGLLAAMEIPDEQITVEVFCGYCPDHDCCCDAVAHHETLPVQELSH